MSLKEQIAWEHEALERGSQRYYAKQDDARRTGRNEDTDVSRFLIADRLEEISKKVEEFATIQTVGEGAAYNKFIRELAFDGDFHRLALIGVKLMFKSITMSKVTLTATCIKVGSHLECDLKCRIFEKKYPGYYNKVMRSFTQQGVSDAVHMQKALMKKFGEFDINWIPWSSGEKVQVGARVVRAVLEVMDDVFLKEKRRINRHPQYVITTTPDFDEWAAAFERERGFLEPMLLPMKVPPVAWTGEPGIGGYYTPRMKSRTPFVRTKGREHMKFVRDNPPRSHFDAINKIQRTAWCVNKRVLEVQQYVYENNLRIGIPSTRPAEFPEFPEHLKDIPKENLSEAQKEEVKSWKSTMKGIHRSEQERKGKVVAFLQGYTLAKELRDWETFYFVYTCDFRGRVYCATAGLTPQGADTAKGVLQFAKGVRLGASGVRWLAIHGANVFGYDKESYEERIAWIKDKEAQIREIVKDPINTAEIWGSADKPYQFLAFCFEWSECDYGRNENYLSSIPVGLDGSCNGLQHFSAMLRDEVGAQATNLLRTSKPEDIYERVAEVARDKLRQSDDERAIEWLRIGVTRKCAKRPVMTLPYGATRQSCRKYIVDYLNENKIVAGLTDDRVWELAVYMTPILWESIGEVVVAARQGMDWLQKHAVNDYMKWLTPLKFPVYQYYKDVSMKTVTTQILGKVNLSVKDSKDPGKPSKRQQKSGIAPNFVHSIDSTHMVMTINITDLPAYAMIHDDFGTHAGNTETLYKAIRVAFRALYTKFDPLNDWADQVGVKDKLPKGQYNIDDILEARYFFG